MADIFGRQMVEFFDRFFRFGGNTDMVLKFLGNDAFMKWMVKAAKQWLDTNPFEQSVEETLAGLRARALAGNWPISEDDYVRLATNPPAWPKGREAYRSLRIRFGEGEEGMVETFRAHNAAIEQVHGNDLKFRRDQRVKCGRSEWYGIGGHETVDRLRLLNGNETHHAVVEWVIINDLAENQNKQAAKARSLKSLADEGLVLAWLFPKRMAAIGNDEKWCDWVCAGYELNLPEQGRGLVQYWDQTIGLGFDRLTIAGGMGLRSVSIDSSFGGSIPTVA